MRNNKSSYNRKYLIAAAIGLLILIIAILEATNTTHFFHKQTVPPVVPAHTNNGQPISNSGSSSQPGSTSDNSSQQSNTPPPEVADHTLITPYGNFVSNHFPGQNGTTTSEASICNTSPGATCYIKFTNVTTGDTTQLATQTADAQGYVSWYWDVDKDAHLTSGKWKITAVATLGGQTKTAEDVLNLVVQ